MKNFSPYLGIVSFMMMVIGFLLCCFQWYTIVNYEHPYIFTLIIVVPGICCGTIIPKKLNSMYDYRIPMYLSIGFIGIFLGLATTINESSASITNHQVKVLHKEYFEGPRGGFSSYSFHFFIGKEKKRWICHDHIGENIPIRSSLNIRYHKSKFGFDFISRLEQ